MKHRVHLFQAVVVALAAGSTSAAVSEVFGFLNGGSRVGRYDVGANTLQDCGPVASGQFSTNLAMDANRRIYYMNPFEGSHVIWTADLDGGNNLINQAPLQTLNTSGFGIIDGFTIGPDQNLYMTGYGKSEIYSYNTTSNSPNLLKEVTLTGGGEYRSDLAFDVNTNYLVGIGIVPDGTGRRSLFQIPSNLATNGANDLVPWEYFGGNTSPWANPAFDLRTLLGGNPDGVAFDFNTGDLYLSGDGEEFSIWDRNLATRINTLPIGFAGDPGMGFDLAFQTAVPTPGAAGLLCLGVLSLGRRSRR